MTFLEKRGKRPLKLILQRLNAYKAYRRTLLSIAVFSISCTAALLFAGDLRLFQAHFSGFCRLYSQKYSPPVWNLSHNRFVKTPILNQNTFL
jgi:hypothetical protein